MSVLCTIHGSEGGGGVLDESLVYSLFFALSLFDMCVRLLVPLYVPLCFVSLRSQEWTRTSNSCPLCKARIIRLDRTCKLL